MKTKILPNLLLTAGLVAGVLTACMSEKAKESKLAARAKVTRAEAEQIALTKAPQGTVKEGELEEENGKLVWSFDIATPGTKVITEVQVDAMTGKVVSIDKETPADEKKEKDKKD